MTATSFSCWLGLVRRASAGALCLLSVAASGCDGCGTRRNVNKVQDAASGDEGRIEVKSTGKEPRVKLAIGRWKGLTYDWDIASSGSFGMQGAKPVRIPEIRSRMRVTVTRGNADPIVRKRGEKTLRLMEEVCVVESLEIAPEGLDPKFVELTNENMSGAIGTRTRTLTAEDGEVVEMKSELVGGIEPSPEEKEAIDRGLELQRRFPFRFPAEELGEGAEWRFSETVRINGVRAVQVADMKLVKLDDNRADIRIKVRHHAPRQEMPHPFVPGATALLERYRADGDGLLVLDRVTALPLESKLSLTARLSLLVPQPQGVPQRTTWIAASVLKGKATLGGSDGGVFEPEPDSGLGEADAAADAGTETEDDGGS